ncbi:MAG: hypothetical protein P8074_24015 [Anaerolineales bacterium]
MLGHFIGISFVMLAVLSFLSYFGETTGIRLAFFYEELAPMQDRWGHDTGAVLHFVEYVIAPLGFGLFFLTGLVSL